MYKIAVIKNTIEKTGIRCGLMFLLKKRLMTQKDRTVTVKKLFSFIYTDD